MDGRVWEALHVAHALRAARRSSTWCTTTWTGCRWRSPGTAARRCSPPCTASPAGDPARVRSGPARAFVSISDADRGPGLDYAATVHHGIDVTALPFQAAPGDGAGRLRPDPPRQGHRTTAIEIARARRPPAD